MPARCVGNGGIASRITTANAATTRVSKTVSEMVQALRDSELRHGLAALGMPTLPLEFVGPKVLLDEPAPMTDRVPRVAACRKIRLTTNCRTSDRLAV